MLIPLVEGLLKVCHRLFQGLGPPGEVKLPLMSFWIELLLPPVHHFRVGEGSWLWSLHWSARLLLPTGAPHFGAEITTTNKVVALGANAAHEPLLPPSGVERVRLEHRQVFVAWSGIQIHCHLCIMHIEPNKRCSARHSAPENIKQES